MLDVIEDNITISRGTWEELKSDDYFREVLEIIEDRETLRKAKVEAEDFISFREYDARRRKKNNL